ncbi:MAG: hypothetical protein CEN88_216 [Candidatus Berkelbacteria bacterium Licking1014_2]|uniref:Uncharacterized protein n=1 Tax=Candidatus Berkelbacteria bacterium Licking1014_2 TaxID=2017146 RepID=A0A554LVZ7_9BACT|nr:MAG: hypothetical protein CEN88_216 [Candidatus Berkelbacteria bacterium Licking1014_2]
MDGLISALINGLINGFFSLFGVLLMLVLVGISGLFGKKIKRIANDSMGMVCLAFFGMMILIPMVFGICLIAKIIVKLTCLILNGV